MTAPTMKIKATRDNGALVFEVFRNSLDGVSLAVLVRDGVTYVNVKDMLDQVVVPNDGTLIIDLSEAAIASQATTSEPPQS